MPDSEIYHRHEYSLPIERNQEDLRGSFVIFQSFFVPNKK